MEIVPMSLPRTGDTHTVGIPFNRRNVEEWSRLDKITGMMEKTKIETDRWSASNNLAAHNYGKVVDSRERNLPDGSLQQRQRKQMEIFQSSVPGGSMQVIRTQTVTTSSSSSQWSSSVKPFDELQLPVNHLDLSSQKTKGSVGRSGSIGTRRPPSRPRSLAGSHGDTLTDVAERCRKLHEEARARMFRGFTNGFDSERPESPGGVVITELDSPSEPTDRKTNLSRQKSCSNENINEETEENNSIRRTSRFRRSLQFPRTSVADDIPDWTNGKSLKERAAEIENLLRCGSTTSYDSNKETQEIDTLEKPAKVKSSFVTAETLKEVRERLRKSSDNDLKDEGIVTEIPRVKDVVSGMEAKISQKPLVNGTGSLESRRNHANHSSEWYRRRKSYGFEDVDDSDKMALTNGDSSSSSGYTSSFSKTESPFKRYIEEPSFHDAAWTRKSPLPNRERSSLRCTKNPWISQLRGTKLVDRQWFSDTPDPEQNDSGVPDSPKENNDDGRTFDFDTNREKKHKKVEFCKTEVHFAPDSGRVNIVETDGKPPNNVVRRRRRNSGTYYSSEITSNTSGLPEFKFGDSPFEKKLLTTTAVTSAEKIDSLSKKIESELHELSKIVVDTIPKEEPPRPVQTLPKLYDVEEEQTDLDGLKSRSILKTIKKTLDETEESTPLWKSTVILRNKRFEDVRRNVEERKSYSSDGESELQIRFRNLKKPDNVEQPEVNVEPITVEIKRRSLPDDVLLNVGLRNIQKNTADEVPRLSVAERIKKAEEFKKLTSSYSTKIDFRSGEMTVLQNGTAKEDKDSKKEVSSTGWGEFRRGLERSSFHSEAKIQVSAPVKPTVVDLTKESEPYYAAPPKVASIALRYEDDPLFKTTPQKIRDAERWEKTSNSSSTMSDRPRERVSYLNGPSLSEKYTRRSSNCSVDSLNEVGALSRVRETRDTLRSSFRSEGAAAPASLSTMSLKDLKKMDNKKEDMIDPVSTLDELSRAANEILVAVNGLTDEDSMLGSSEDDEVSRRVIKKGKVTSLTTISEGKKITNGSNVPGDSDKKTVREKSLSSRAIRLLQRASNREAMISQISSSEDIPANVEPVKKKLVRKPRVVTAKKDEDKEKEEKICSRTKITRTKKEEATCVVHREREKTVSSAAKEVKKPSSKTYQLPTENRFTGTTTKPSQRRELLSQADAAAEQSVRRKRAPTTTTSKATRDESTITKRRTAKVSLRKVEATRVSQAV